MDAGSDHGSAAKGSAIDLEVTGSDPVSLSFTLYYSCSKVFYKFKRNGHLQMVQQLLTLLYTVVVRGHRYYTCRHALHQP